MRDVRNANCRNRGIENSPLPCVRFVDVNVFAIEPERDLVVIPRVQRETTCAAVPK